MTENERSGRGVKLFGEKFGADVRVRNPRTGKLDYRFAPPTEDGLREIVSRLRSGQPAWASSGAERRADVLGQFGEAIEARRLALTEALVADTGRRAIAEQEVAGFLAGLARWRRLAPGLLQTERRPSEAFPDIELQSRHAPYPVVGAISPWNFPLLLSFIDAVPALLAGCAVVIKPSEVTPRFAAPVAEAIAATPELAEVLSITLGAGATGAALIPLVDAVAFTGSVATGRKVAEAAARAFIPAFLELGGKDPALVLAGADLDRAATAILRASVAATGQACQSIERIYVHRYVHDAFLEALTRRAQAVSLSYPDAASGVIGPLIFERQAGVIEAHLRDAVAKGARILCGGKVRTLGGGYWIEPTVVADVTHEMTLMTEETFGPVMPVMAFADADEAVALANDSVYGLSAAVFAASEAEALAVADRIEAGGISINDAGLTTTISEIEKSGFGLSGAGPSRMGPTGLTRFLRRKALFINRGAVAPIDVMAERGGR